MKIPFVDKLFEVAGLRFLVRMLSNSELWKEMDGYSPFVVVDDGKKDLLFSLEVWGLLRKPDGDPFFVDSPEGPLGPEISMYNESGGWCLICAPSKYASPVFSLHTDYTLTKARLRIGRNNNYNKFCIDNALMLLFALNTGRKGFLLIRSWVIEHKGKGYVFLGRNRSVTDSVCRCWKEQSPEPVKSEEGFLVIRSLFEKVMVYSTPWSDSIIGEHVALRYPVKSFVWVYENDRDEITLTDITQSYGAILESCSRFRIGAMMTNTMFHNTGPIAESVPYYLLGVKSDAEAADLCVRTITS